LAGVITKTNFLQMLKHHSETHQICFCTTSALVFLEQPNLLQISKISHIGEPLIEQIMFDFNTDEEKSADMFFSSKTFGQLADISTQLYQKP
jgi:hypothetical protein